MDSQFQSHQGENEPQSPSILQRTTNDLLPHEVSKTEAEAITILYSQNFPRIMQILRFRLYGHTESLQWVLQYFQDHQLDRFFMMLGATHQAITNLDKAEKVEAILELVESTRPPLLLPQSWRFLESQDVRSPLSIATDIDDMSCSLLKDVPFEDWLRHALGYEEHSVNRFFIYHEDLRNSLSSYLCYYPEEYHKYLKVKKVDSFRYNSSNH